MTVTVAMFIKYENDKKSEMLSSPSDRRAVSQKAVAAMGGKVIDAYGSCGEYDMMFIYEMPDMATVAANMMLADASGMSKTHKIIPLFTNDEFMAAQIKAGNMRDSYSAVTSDTST